MTETLKISCMNCDFCTAKNHCASCSADLAQSLLQKRGIEAAEMNIPERTLRVTHTLAPDDLEDILDGMGVLVG